MRARLSALFSPPPDTDALVAHAPTQRLGAVARRFWPDARPYRTVLVAGALVAMLVPALETAGIWLFKEVVDAVVVPRDLGALPPYVAAYLALALLGGIITFADDYLGVWVGERFVLRLRARVFAHLQSLEPDGLDERRLGDLLARLGGDVAAIDDLLAAVAEALSAMARLLFFAGALLLLSWKLALASLVVVPLSWWAARHFARLSRRAARERRRRSGSLTAVAEEALGAAALVQSANAQERELARLQREGEGMVQAELAATRVTGAFRPVVDVIELIGALSIIGLGTWALAAGDLTLGGLLAFLAFLTQLYRPVRTLGSLGATVFEATAGAERVIELLDRAPAVRERPGARDPGRARGELVLEDVTVAYPGASRPALDGVTLRVAPGHSVALTGASGAGKSTLVKLLLRFRDPDAGAVRLDGTDLRDLTLAGVRANVAVVLQDAPMLDAPVRDNVAYARPGATDAEVAAALHAAGLAPESLPAGLDTPAGPRGRALSGGERRRVAIARALLQDAPVLVLDEPTAGLDPASVQRLLGPLRRLMRERTTVLVTHDPAIAAEADAVLRLGEPTARARG